MDICLDTNTLLSHLFLAEPYNHEITLYLQNHPHDNYYLTGHVKKECDNIFYKKQKLFRIILIDFITYLNDYHNKIINMDNILNKFIRSIRGYEFKNEPVSLEYIKKILSQIWIDESIQENTLGYDVFCKFTIFKNNLDYELFKHKHDLYNKMIFIPSARRKYGEILNKLIHNGSHEKDNLIILDLYEYHLKNPIGFIFITFDNSFYNALINCSFEFIIDVKNYKNLIKFT